MTNTAGAKQNAELASPYSLKSSSQTRSMASSVKSGLRATLLSLYVFLLVSRILDISPIAFLHIPLLLLIALLLAALAQGGLPHVLSSKITVFFGATTAWVLIAFPLSSWRGGSVQPAISAVQSFALYLIILQLVKTHRDWKRVALAFAYAVCAAGILSFFFGRSVDGRISFQAGTLSDPNEFALVLAVGLPFWWLKASESKFAGKLICLLCSAPILVSFGRAGSRSGLLALGSVFLVMLLFANMKQRFVMIAVAAVALVAGTFFLPGYLKVRFTTIFQPHDAGQLDAQSRERLGADIDSVDSRQLLLKQSIHMTFEHPIFGVGPGVFGTSAWDERKQEGLPAGQMLVSHNTYTQFSSETGIPGFLFFVITLALSMKYTLSNYLRNSRTNEMLAKRGLCLFAALASLAVGIFFLSIAYTMLLAVMFGLAASLSILTTSEPASEMGQPPEPRSWNREQPSAPTSAGALRLKPRPKRRLRFGGYADRG